MSISFGADEGRGSDYNPRNHVDNIDDGYKKEYRSICKLKKSGQIESVKGHAILDHVRDSDPRGDSSSVAELRRVLEWSLWVYIKKAKNIKDRDNVSWSTFKDLHKFFVQEARHMTFDKYTQYIRYAGDPQQFEALISAFRYVSREYDINDALSFGMYNGWLERTGELIDQWERYGGQGDEIDLCNSKAVSGMNTFCRLCLEKKSRKKLGCVISMQTFFDWMTEYNHVVDLMVNGHKKSSKCILDGEVFASVPQNELVKVCGVTFQMFVPEFRKIQNQHNNAQRQLAQRLMSEIHEALHHCGLHPSMCAEVPWRALKIMLVSDLEQKGKFDNIFKKYDARTKNKLLSFDDLMDHYSPFQAFLMITSGDVDNNYSLSYPEFLAARDVTQQFLADDVELHSLFEHYDSNHDGLISYEELYGFLHDQAERWTSKLVSFDPMQVADWTQRVARKNSSEGFENIVLPVCRAIFPNGYDSPPINFEEFVKNSSYKKSKLVTHGTSTRKMLLKEMGSRGSFFVATRAKSVLNAEIPKSKRCFIFC